jgi:hypothetical protein
LRWTSDGEIDAISLRAEVDGIHLTYRARVGGGEWVGRSPEELAQAFEPGDRFQLYCTTEITVCPRRDDNI